MNQIFCWTFERSLDQQDNLLSQHFEAYGDFSLQYTEPLPSINSRSAFLESNRSFSIISDQFFELNTNAQTAWQNLQTLRKQR